ncbi:MULTISPECIES: YfhO family protein [unclassified Paenibacillus]|uniref:YfhO family protein n=1 Tax=unclassified Paenibacillus TaxID=185978 RepID=UPI00362E13BC
MYAVIIEKIKKHYLNYFSIICYYSLIFLVFFSSVIFNGKLLSPGDAMLYYRPVFEWGFDLWNPYIFSGFPQFGDPQAMIWYLPRIIFKVFSWNYFVVFAYVAAASFMYGFSLKLTNNKFAAFLAGITYSMSGFFMGHLGHTAIIHAACWIPLILWGLYELNSKYQVKWFCITAFAVSMCILAGHPQMMTYSLGLGCLYVLFLSINNQNRFKFIGITASTYVLGILLSSIQLLPTLELSQLSLRSSMDFQTFNSYHLPLKQILMVFFPYLFGGIPNIIYDYPYFGEWNLTELIGYVGWLPFILIIFFFTFKLKLNKNYFFWAIVCFFSFLLTLGDTTPLSKILFHIPGYNLFRAPARHFVEYSLSFSVIVALIFSDLKKVKASYKSNLCSIIVVFVFIVLVLCGILLFEESISKMALKNGNANFSVNPLKNFAVMFPIVLCFVSLVLCLRYVNLKKKSFISFSIILFVIIDLSSFGWNYEWKYAAPLDKPEISATVSSIEKNRIAVFEGALSESRDLVPNSSQLLGIRSVNGYNPLMLTDYNKLTEIDTSGILSNNLLDEKNIVLDILGVKNLYKIFSNNKIISKDGILFTEEKFSKVVSTNSTYSLQLNGENIVGDALLIEGTLGGSVSIKDSTEISKMQVIYQDNTNQMISILTGEDVSEWAYDRDDVSPKMQHKKANVFEKFVEKDNKGNDFFGNRYLMNFKIMHKTIKEINILFAGPSDSSLEISRITVHDSGNNESHPIDLNNSLSKNRWKLMKQVGNTNVYENVRSLPQAWFVDEVRRMEKKEILNTLQTSLFSDKSIFNPHNTALIDVAEELPLNFQYNDSTNSQTNQIVIKAFNNSGLHLETKTSDQKFLVLSESYYPGWKAYINGVETKVYKVDYLLRGINVPVGDNTIEFKFEPRSFIIGLNLSIFAFLVLVSLIIIAIVRKKKIKI